MSVQDPDNKSENTDSKSREPATSTADDAAGGEEALPKEIGGRGGLDPTRYGDWEKAGRCIDF